MTRRWRYALGLLVVVLLTTAYPAAPATADASCERYSDRGGCLIGVELPGTPSTPGAPAGGGDSEGDTPRALPECGEYPDGRMDPPPGESGWVQVRCMEGSLQLVLWVEGAASSPEQIARSVLAQVTLRPIQIGLTPLDPDVMTVVGMPVWLWVDEPSQTTWGPATISAAGITLTAEVESVTWTMGDGARLRCGKGTPWRPSMENRDGSAQVSPTCGHMYERQGNYEVRARSNWVARWSGYGQSGTIPFSLSTTRVLRVGELQVIVTRGSR